MVLGALVLVANAQAMTLRHLDRRELVAIRNERSPSCTTHFRAIVSSTQAINCTLPLPVVHVYVNGQELLVADMLNRSATAAVYYGDETIVRVVQRGSRYRITAVSLLGYARVGVRIVPS